MIKYQSSLSVKVGNFFITLWLWCMICTLFLQGGIRIILNLNFEVLVITGFCTITNHNCNNIECSRLLAVAYPVIVNYLSGWANTPLE